MRRCIDWLLERWPFRPHFDRKLEERWAEYVLADIAGARSSPLVVQNLPAETERVRDLLRACLAFNAELELFLMLDADHTSPQRARAARQMPAHVRVLIRALNSDHGASPEVTANKLPGRAN